MNLSVVIPTYTITTDLGDMALNCARSYRSSADELIISEDGGAIDLALAAYPDLYSLFQKNVGFTKHVNRSWNLATGDFVAIASSDTYLLEGDLHDLMIPGKITSPKVENQAFDSFGVRGCFFVVPRDLKEKYGMLDESMHTYYSDTEYKERVLEVTEIVDSVVIWHGQSVTVTAAGKNTPEQSGKDKEAYEAVLKLRK